METTDVWAYLENERRSRLIKGIAFVEVKEKIKIGRPPKEQTDDIA